ncbi:MAG: LamG domain-containing protein, partial [Deltaproteobacteria bacterium]
TLVRTTAFPGDARIMWRPLGQIQMDNRISPTQLSWNVWHHVAVTFDGSVGRVFLDGVLDSEVVYDGFVSIPTDPGTVMLGGETDPHGGQSGFAGLIDELRIVRAALTPEQVAADAARRGH